MQDLVEGLREFFGGREERFKEGEFTVESSKKRSLCTAAFVAFLMFAFVTFISACGIPKPLSSAQLIDEIEKADLYKPEGVPITSVEITKRQTNKETKSDTAYCEVHSQTNDIAYVTYYRVDSAYYDTGGWQVVRVRPDSVDDWSASPLAPVSIGQVKWDVLGSDAKRLHDRLKSPVFLPFDELTIREQNSQSKVSETGEDVVVVDVKLDKGLLSVEGSMVLRYKFWHYTTEHLFSDGPWDIKDFVAEWCFDSATLGQDYKETWDIVGVWEPVSLPSTLDPFEIEILVAEPNRVEAVYTREVPKRVGYGFLKSGTETHPLNGRQTEGLIYLTGEIEGRWDLVYGDEFPHHVSLEVSHDGQNLLFRESKTKLTHAGSLRHAFSRQRCLTLKRK